MERIEKIELKNITKRFSGILANSHINIDFNSSQVHTLLGENGAGKSTLMGILYGKYIPDEGEILINGKPVNITSPKDAISLGIGMIHQHFMLVPSLTVAENIILNYPSQREPFLDLRAAKKRIKDLAEDYGLLVKPDNFIWELSVGEQQRIEILKLLFREASFLILDEPTAVLTPPEVERLFETLEKLLIKGHGVIFISHKLPEAMKISHRITVLKDGRVVGETTPKETSKNLLARLMVGRELDVIRGKEKKPGEEIVLEIKDLHVENDMKILSVKNLSLEVRRGEILGIAGVSGNGQRELAEAIMGLRKIKKGKILVNNIDITNKSPSFIIKEGVAFIPEERMVMGIIKDFSVSENIILKEHHVFPLSSWIFLNFKNIRDFSQKLVSDFNIKTSSIDSPLRNLSGGNIQKLILARELSSEPVLLVASHPTRGVDIGSTEYIHERILEKREDGTGIFLLSEDLDEIIALSDRIAIIYEGEIAGIVPPSTSLETIGLMMGGELIG